MKNTVFKLWLVFILIALAFLANSVNAQNNTTTRLVKFRTGVQNASDTAEVVANSGNVWYDFVTNRYRCNENGVNLFWGGSNSGGDFWPLAGEGVLTDSVNIDANGNDIEFTDVDTLQFTPFRFNVFTTSNFFSLFNAAGDGIQYTSGSAQFTHNTNVIIGSPFSRINFSVNNATMTGKLTASTTTNFAGINVGSFAGDPVTLVNGDAWYNSSSGLMRMRKTGSTYTYLGTTGLTSGRVTFADATDNVTDEAAFTYNSTTNTLTTDIINPNNRLSFTGIVGDVTSPQNGQMWYNSSVASIKKRTGGVTYDVIGSNSMGNNRIAYGQDIGNISAETAFTYDPTINSVLLSNSAGTFSTSLFGGEIQFNQISNGNDFTLNSSGFTLSDGTTGDAISLGYSSNAFVFTTTNSDTRITTTDIYISNALDTGTSANELMTRNTSTGKIEVIDVSDISIDGTYTPTINNTTNVASSTSAICQYIRTGTTATVSGVIEIVVTDPTQFTAFDISLPFGANFTTATQAGGGGSSFLGAGIVPLQIYANSATEVVRMQYYSNGANVTHSISFQFMYSNILPL